MLRIQLATGPESWEGCRRERQENIRRLGYLSLILFARYMLNGSEVYYQAKAALDPQASAVFVPATLAAKAIEEAIEAEIPLIVSVAEGMPVHDCLRVQFLHPYVVN